MGLGVPMALGAAMVSSSPTILVVGDGGIGAPFAELKLAVERNLPLIVALFSDGGFGSIRGRAREQGFTTRPLTTHAPSWLDAFASIGFAARPIRTLDDINDALGSWRSGPLFLEHSFDPTAYGAMVAALRA